jgi:hypothetical protein
VASPFRTDPPPFEPRSGVESAIRLRPDTVREPDPADRLPSAAAVRLRQLIAANEDAHAVRQAISDRRGELQAERGRLDTRIRQLTAQRLEVDAPQIVQARADLEGVKARKERQAGSQDDRSTRSCRLESDDRLGMRH